MWPRRCTTGRRNCSIVSKCQGVATTRRFRDGGCCVAVEFETDGPIPGLSPIPSLGAAVFAGNGASADTLVAACTVSWRAHHPRGSGTRCCRRPCSAKGPERRSRCRRNRSDAATRNDAGQSGIGQRERCARGHSILRCRHRASDRRRGSRTRCIRRGSRARGCARAVRRRSCAHARGPTAEVGTRQ